MVYYRKYRPQTIGELDNASLRETLTSVLSKPSIPHAFLFTGPKGLGKTSTARIVAKVVNCERVAHVPRGEKTVSPMKLARDTRGTLGTHDTREGIEPDNTCEQCVSITNGTNLDVFEIDAASNRGIDEIRDLKDKIRLAPIAAAKKVYIIDEVHMLTTEAFNALLKTLEEPPDHALFILCTTEPHKIPATILSRCFHIAFTSATNEELVRAFGRIVKGESIKIDDDALLDIAHLSDGGFRDGVKILEEMVALSNGQQITKAFIDEKYHISGVSSHVSSLLEALAKKDTKAGLSVIADAAKQGIDMKYLLEQVIEALHELLLVRVGVQESKGQTLPAIRQRVKGKEFEVGDIKRLFGLFSQAGADMKYAVLPQLPLEMAVIEWTQAPIPQQSIPTKVTEDISTPTPVEKKADNSLGTFRKQVGDIKKQQILNGEDPSKTPQKPKDESVSGVSILSFNAKGEPTPEWLSELWKHIIINMKDYNHTIAGVMRGCSLKSYDRKTIVIETAYKFHKERLEENKTLTALEKAASNLVGIPVQVKIELKGK